MSFFKEWWEGARIHPGWGYATFFMLLCALAADGRWFGWVVGVAWYVPVILTCRSVEKANRNGKESHDGE